MERLASEKLLLLVLLPFGAACSESSTTDTNRQFHDPNDASTVTGSIDSTDASIIDASVERSTATGSDGTLGDSASPDHRNQSGLIDVSTPLAHCRPNEGDQCPSGAACVEGCPFGLQSSIPEPGGVCSVPGREPCGCGAFDQPCTTPGLECLYPSCCDFAGICVTPEEKTAICMGPDAIRFACVP